MAQFGLFNNNINFVQNIITAANRPIWNCNKIDGVPVDITGIDYNQTIVYNGTGFIPGDGSGGGGPTGPIGPTGPSSSSLTRQFNTLTDLSAGQPVVQISNNVMAFTNLTDSALVADIGTSINVLTARIAFDDINKVGIYVYFNSSSSKFFAVGFSVLNTTISTGTPVDISAFLAANSFLQLINTGSSRFCLTFHTISSSATYKILGFTINPNTLAITTGSVANASTTTTTQSVHTVCYNSTTDRIVLSMFTTASTVVSIVITQTGTSFTLGTEATLFISLPNNLNCCSVSLDDARIIVSASGSIVACTVNGGTTNTLTFGNILGMTGSNQSYCVSCDFENELVILLNGNEPSTPPLLSVFSLSSLILDYRYYLDNASFPNPYPYQVIDICFDTVLGYFIMFQNVDYNTPGSGILVSPFSVSDSSITFESSLNTTITGEGFSSSFYTSGFVIEKSCLYNYRQNMLLVPCTDGSEVDFRIGIVIFTESDKFIGFAQEDATANETTLINIRGGTNDFQTSLVPETDYYLTSAGNMSATPNVLYAGRALSSTDLLISTIIDPALETYVSVGVGCTYSTVKKAIQDGKKSLFLRTATTDSSSITLTSDVNILINSGITWTLLGTVSGDFSVVITGLGNSIISCFYSSDLFQVINLKITNINVNCESVSTNDVYFCKRTANQTYTNVVFNAGFNRGLIGCSTGTTDYPSMYITNCRIIGPDSEDSSATYLINSTNCSSHIVDGLEIDGVFNFGGTLINCDSSPSGAAFNWKNVHYMSASTGGILRMNGVVDAFQSDYDVSPTFDVSNTVLTNSKLQLCSCYVSSTYFTASNTMFGNYTSTGASSSMFSNCHFTKATTFYSPQTRINNCIFDSNVVLNATGCSMIGCTITGNLTLSNTDKTVLVGDYLTGTYTATSATNLQKTANQGSIP